MSAEMMEDPPSDDDEDTLLAYQKKLYRSRNRRPPNSLLGQVKAAKQQSVSIWQFVVNSIEIISRSMVVLCLSLVLCLFPVTLIVVGFMYRNECPIEPHLPLYVMLHGISGTCLVFPMILRGITECDEDIRRRGCGSYLWLGVASFLVVWLIYGTILISRSWNYVTYDKFSKHRYCQKPLYLAAVWTTGATYSLIFLLLLFCAGICLKISVEPKDY